MSKQHVGARGPREGTAPEPRDREAGAPALAGHVHDLSVPGGRPLCGADAVLDPPPRPAAPVTCPACSRLLGDDARRRAHAASPRADESED